MNQETKSYRDLVTWQRALDLAHEVNQITRFFPKEERFGLTSQIRRAGVSVPANIAEGQGRLSKGEFRYFLGVARGSLSELDTLLILAERAGFIDHETHQKLEGLIVEVRRPLQGLISSLRPSASF
jgi:four helix bundle protein